MKNLCIGLIITILLLSVGHAQYLWQKYSGNPVLTHNTDGRWDSLYVFSPNVRKHGDLYYMLYNGKTCYGDPSCGPYTAGMASSPDGINWTTCGNNPLLGPNPESEWDSNSHRNPRAISENDTLKIWYHGGVGGGGAGVGYAWTTDNMCSWTIYEDNPVMWSDSVGTRKLTITGIVHQDSLYHIYYWDPWGELWDDLHRVGHSRSLNGTNWSQSLDTVMHIGEPGSWDEEMLCPSDVIHNETQLEMWYWAYNFKGMVGIGFATSDDGINWTKHPDNPVLMPGRSFAWDSNLTHFPTVIYEKPIYKMWYTGKASGDPFLNIGYATSLQGFESLAVPRAYRAPDSGDVLVSAVFSGDTTELELWAEIEDSDDKILDSIRIYDDGLHEDGQAGDKVFANTTPTPDSEGYFRIGLSARKAGENIIDYDDLQRFTTVGPLKFQFLEQVHPDSGVIDPNMRIYFDLSLKNLGSAGTAKDIKVVIEPADTNATIFGGYASGTFGDILPGETKSISGYPGYVALHTAADCAFGTPIRFNMVILSEGKNYWHEQDVLLGYVGSAVSTKSELPVPLNYGLEQNYPNPFNPTTNISYELPTSSNVILTIYDISGRAVTTLTDNQQPAGTYNIHWAGTDDSGNLVSTGVYFCRLVAGDYSKTIKMVYLK